MLIYLVARARANATENDGNEDPHEDEADKGKVERLWRTKGLRGIILQFHIRVGACEIDAEGNNITLIIQAVATGKFPETLLKLKKKCSTFGDNPLVTKNSNGTPDRNGEAGQIENCADCPK